MGQLQERYKSYREPQKFMEAGVYPFFREISGKQGTEVVMDGHDVLMFGSNAYTGLTGDQRIIDAAKAAVEAVDTCVGRMVDAVLAKGGVALLTADHGNADKMFEEDGSPFTAHTTNPVPFVVVGKECELREGGVLADIAPTMLQLLEVPQPAEMTGKSLIK